MRRALLLPLCAVTVIAAVAVPSAAATRECKGLQVCVPIAGPWVVVPTAATTVRPQTEYVLSCPRGYIVGGLDAELSTPALELAFDAKLGSPVNPGVSTTRDAVFHATKTSRPAARASFRPHIGCVPTSGGGAGRPPTAIRPAGLPASLAAVFPPGQPTVRRSVNLSLLPGRLQRLSLSCGRGERLLGAARALGFYSEEPPTPALMSGVATTLSMNAARARVTVRNRLGINTGATVQLTIVCAGGR